MNVYDHVYNLDSLLHVSSSMLPLATVTIASSGLSPVTYPEQVDKGETTNKNNTLKTIERTIIVAPLELLLVICLEQGSKVRNTIRDESNTLQSFLHGNLRPKQEVSPRGDVSHIW
jgi:hypothetical protein